MNKELEALERIKEFYPTWHLYNREDFNILKLALMNREILLKECDNTYQVLNNHHIKSLSELNERLSDYENTKLRLDDTQTLLWQEKKKVDAFDIIVNKDVDVAMLKSILHADKSLHTASYYNSYFVATYRHLTQEEYDLLKEVLL